MAICDVCNDEASLDAGTCYTADEFRKVVAGGFERQGAIYEASRAILRQRGLPENVLLDGWKQFVRESTTGWFLCPSCAARAGKILPKPAGTYAEFVDQLAPRAHAEALAKVAPVQRSGAVTTAGFMLIALGGIAIGVYLAAINEDSLWGWLVALLLLSPGLATVRRWRGWRVCAGLFSWSAIALSAMVVQSLLLDPSWKPQPSTIAERVLWVAAFALFPGAVGIFALWAKRKEPAGDGGRAVAVTVAGVILVFSAVFYVGVGIVVETWAFAFAFLMAGFCICAAQAIFRRWKYWRGGARLAAWVTIVLLVIYGIGRIFENDLTRLVGVELLLAIFGFILWAVRAVPIEKGLARAAPRAPPVQAGAGSLSSGQPQAPPADDAGVPDRSLADMADRLEAALRKPAAKTEAHSAPTSTALGPSSQIPAKSDWTPTVPGISCHRPLKQLQHVFVFASGDVEELGGPVLVGVLQDAAEGTFEDIKKQAQIDMISKSTEPTEIFRTGQLPERALDAMEVIAPALITRHRKGEGWLCVRPFEDPHSGQDFAIFLFYSK